MVGPVPPGLFSTLGGLMVKSLQAQEATSIEEIPTLIRKDAKRLRITYGPFKLRGREVRNCYLGKYR